MSLISEVNDNLKEVNDIDQSHIYYINCTVNHIRQNDSLYYLACKNDNCRKKVVENNGTYHCENCQKTYDSCKPTYMIRARVSDFTDSFYVTFAREHGATLFGKTAEEFKQM